MSKRKRVGKPHPVYSKIADDIEPKIPESVTHSHYNGGVMHDHKAELRIRTQAVAIGVPMDELMFSKFFVNYLQIDYMPWDPILTTTSTYLPDARNKIHNTFLEGTTADHLLMLDSDVLPPPRIIESLLTHDKDMVGGYYVKKEKFPVKDGGGNTSYIQRPVVYDFDSMQGESPMYVQRLIPGSGLESVDGAGAGLWLMSRKVAEALGKDPYDMAHGGEDLVLCRKIKNLGFEMFIDWSLRGAHCGVFFV